MIKYEHLVGLPFVHGSTDCYGIVRRIYKDNWDIELTDYARPDGWWDMGMNLYMEHFYDEGFRSVDEPISKIEEGDVLLLAIKSEVANHAGVYVGNGLVLHHYYGRLSEVRSMNGVFRNALCAHIRHKDVVIGHKEETVDLMDLIHPSKRAVLEEITRRSTAGQ